MARESFTFWTRPKILWNVPRKHELQTKIRNTNDIFCTYLNVNLHRLTSTSVAEAYTEDTLNNIDEISDKIFIFFLTN